MVGAFSCGSLAALAIASRGQAVSTDGPLHEASGDSANHVEGVGSTVEAHLALPHGKRPHITPSQPELGRWLGQSTVVPLVEWRFVEAAMRTHQPVECHS